MAPVNYNNSFGGRKLSIPPRRNGKRIGLILILLLLIVGGGAWIVFSRAPARADAASPARTPVKTPVAVKPAETVKPQPRPAAATARTAAAAVKPAAVQPGKTLPDLVKTPPVKSAKMGVEYRQLLGQAEKLLSSGEFPQARETAEKAMAQVTPDSIEWLDAARVLGQANLKILFSDCPLPGKKEKYKVVPGDALQKIARKYNVTVAAVQRGNRMRADNNNIMVGQVLKIYRGDWRIVISKKDFRLYLYDGDRLFKYYDISIGRQGRTPHGQFRIYAKVKEPDWYSPHGKVPFSSKDNVLGTRWLKLKPEAGTEPDLSGYGIHGTWDRDSIGKSRSNGCIRMLNEDVEELFDIVPHQTHVTIND